MRQIVFSGQYKKDLKLARKRNLPEDELNDVIFKLASDIPLPLLKGKTTLCPATMRGIGNVISSPIGS